MSAERGPIVGVDVGGTKAHLMVSSGQERIVPSAAWHRSGLDGVAAGILQLLDETLDASPVALAVGAHGCDSGDQRLRLQETLASALKVPVLAVNDAELLLPAAGLARGVAVIVGTGSITVAYDVAGELMIAGGWGGYIGDEGSATGLFREAARKVVAASDRGDEDDPLGAALITVLDLHDLRDLPLALGGFERPTAWAKHTPEVFNRALGAGSELARQVVEEGAQALVDLVLLLEKRGADVSTVVAGGGVVANASWMRDALRRAINLSAPALELILLDTAPVAGAVRLATDLAALASGNRPSTSLHPALLPHARVYGVLQDGQDAKNRQERE